MKLVTLALQESSGITIADWLMILAVVLSPLIAIQAQKALEAAKEKRGQKREIFRRLMSTRATRTSPSHVEALNMIDLEFRDKGKEKRVLNAWNIYRDHLNQKYEEDTFKAWCAKGDDLFTEVLLGLSQYLGFSYDEVKLKRGFYYPVAHGEAEVSGRLIREGLVELFTGKAALPMTLVVPEAAQQRHEAVQTALIEVLEGRRAVQVQTFDEAGPGNRTGAPVLDAGQPESPGDDGDAKGSRPARSVD